MADVVAEPPLMSEVEEDVIEVEEMRLIIRPGSHSASTWDTG